MGYECVLHIFKDNIEIINQNNIIIFTLIPSKSIHRAHLSSLNAYIITKTIIFNALLITY